MIPLQAVRYCGMIIGMRRAEARAHLFAHAARRSKELGEHCGPKMVRMSHDTWTALIRDLDPDEVDAVRSWHPLQGGPDRLFEVPVITDERVRFGVLEWRWPE